MNAPLHSTIRLRASTQQNLLECARIIGHDLDVSSLIDTLIDSFMISQDRVLVQQSIALQKSVKRAKYEILEVK